VTRVLCIKQPGCLPACKSFDYISQFVVAGFESSAKICSTERSAELYWRRRRLNVTRLSGGGS